MHIFALSIFSLAAAVVATAKTIVINVGGNTTNDATTIFQPNSVVASQGDTVVFNFTNGNHTATQSTFAAPCVPIHDTNVTINGFDSSFRNAGNEQAITTLPVAIDSNDTIWFFDYNTCAQGGVGAINVNTSSTQTIAGFQRNAERLNGTASSSSASATPTASKTGSNTDASPSTTKTSDATRITAQGAIAMIFAFAALAVSF